MSMICSNCGIELRDDAKFCPNCGSKVEPIAAAPIYDAPTTILSAPEFDTPVQETPVYEAPAPTYKAPEKPVYSAPVQPGPAMGQPEPPKTYSPQYGAPQQQYGAPQQQYGAPQQQYGAPQQQYGAPAGQPQPPRQPAYYAPNNAPAQGQYGRPMNGAPAQPAYGAPGYGVQTQQPQPKKKGKVGLIIGIVAGVLVVAIVIGILFATGVFGGIGGKGASTPEAAISNFGSTVDKMFNGNASFDDLLDAMYEWNYMKPENKSEVQEEIDEYKEDFNSSIALVKAFYDDISLSCKVTKTETMSKSEMEDYLEDKEIAEYCTTDKITEICTCSVTTTITYGGETQENTSEMVCIKADGKWYISMSEMDL